MENSSKNRKLMGAALALRMRLLKKAGEKWATEPRLAEVLGKSVGAIAQWKRGTRWPSQTEESAVAQFLRVPPTFFTQIAEGVRYEDAIQFPASETQKEDKQVEKIRNLTRDMMGLIVDYLSEEDLKEVARGLLEALETGAHETREPQDTGRPRTGDVTHAD